MTQKRYKGNGLYQYIVAHHLESEYAWSADDAWILLYANADLEPRLLTLAVAVPREFDLTKCGFGSQVEEKLWHASECLAKASGLPLMVIRFSDSSGEPKEFAAALFIPERMADAPTNFPLLSSISSAHLRRLFESAGIDVRADSYSTIKAINDASSSSFHVWQRHHLGRGVVAIDLDLCKIKEDGAKLYPEAIYELKRSKVPFEKWKPYPDDYPNYVLQNHFAEKIGIDYQIVFNHYHVDNAKKRQVDELEKLKVFRVLDTDNLSFECQVISIDDLLYVESQRHRNEKTITPSRNKTYKSRNEANGSNENPSLSDLIRQAQKSASWHNGEHYRSRSHADRDYTR